MYKLIVFILLVNICQNYFKTSYKHFTKMTSPCYNKRQGIQTDTKCLF